MKIAFINIYQGGVERGLETFVSELSKRFQKKHEVYVYTENSEPITRWPILWRAYLDPHGVKIAFFTLRLLTKIWREKYDIVFPLNGGWQPALVRIITWLYGGKVIIPGQSGRGWDDRNNLWCFPDYFIALSSEGKRWAGGVNPFVAVEKIPNGVDLKKFTPKGARRKVSLERPIVICQGAAEPSKRLDLAISAVSTLKNVSLLVVGGGSLQARMNALGKRVLGGRFSIIQVNHDKMPSIYRAGDVFTLPSEDTEAFGISYIEAMATNLPVVATDNPTRREIVGEAGIFVDPRNTLVYAEAIKKALSTSWEDKPRIQAEKFDWDKITQAYEDLFEKINK